MWIKGKTRKPPHEREGYRDGWRYFVLLRGPNQEEIRVMDPEAGLLGHWYRTPEVAHAVAERFSWLAFAIDQGAGKRERYGQPFKGVE